MARFRWTVRTMILVVAVAACALGYVHRLQRLSAEYEARARVHQAALVNLMSRCSLGRSPWLIHRQIDRERMLTDRYRYASRHPWMAVAPDPPEPR